MAKNVLVELAATRLGVKPDELTIAHGIVSGGGKQVSYGELIAGKMFSGSRFGEKGSLNIVI